MKTKKTKNKIVDSKTTKLIELSRRFIQSSISFMKFINYVFREYYYVIIKIKYFVIEKSLKICVDIDCFMIMKNKQRYKKIFESFYQTTIIFYIDL